MSDLANLSKQVQQLIAINDIKDLNYSYWYAVDTKNPDALREVFAEGEILIDFEDCPTFHNRDDFVEFFRSLALDAARQENHYGSGPRIKILSDTSAEGHWRLNMFAYNYESRTVMRVTGEYDVKYSYSDGRWAICHYVFKRHSLSSETIGMNGEVTHPNFGGHSPEANAHLFGKAE